ncbi:hypothetical protein C8R43DRAFT_966695 [Mycena crocata]|nr:hypothetical protein C8R43DRAFT_966695 [Mycena crocata]
MVVPSLSKVYRLVLFLCLLQIGSAVCTMLIFGLTATAISQLMLVLPALFTLPATYQLCVVHFISTSIHHITVFAWVGRLKATRQIDHKLSRVDKHVHGLVILLVVIAASSLPAIGLLDTQLTFCAFERFLDFRCVPIMLDIVLPTLTCIIVIFSMALVMSRARAIHGVEMVPLPVVAPELVPAWTLARIAEIDMESGSENGGNGVRL